MKRTELPTTLTTSRWVIVALLSISSVAAAEDVESASEGTLHVEVLDIQNDKGQVGCSLFVKPDGFPSDAKKALKSMFVTPKNKKATCTFTSVKPGTYAVSIMHDLDKNGDLDTSLIGRPKEPWGVSNDAPAERFGPPKFDAAAFKYSGAPTTLKIKLHD